MEVLAQIVGLIGVVINLVAYFLLASGRLANNDARYYWLNILGTLMLAYSLLYQWNLPSMVSQAIWVTISVAGLVRIARRKRREAA